MASVQANGHYHAQNDKFATSFQVSEQRNYVSIMHGSDWAFTSNIETLTVDQDGVATVVTVNGHLQRIPGTREAATAELTLVKNSVDNPGGEIGYSITANGEVLHSNPLQALQSGTVVVEA